MDATRDGLRRAGRGPATPAATGGRGRPGTATSPGTGIKGGSVDGDVDRADGRNSTLDCFVYVFRVGK